MMLGRLVGAIPCVHDAPFRREPYRVARGRLAVVAQPYQAAWLLLRMWAFLICDGAACCMGEAILSAVRRLSWALRG